VPPRAPTFVLERLRIIYKTNMEFQYTSTKTAYIMWNFCVQGKWQS